MHDAQYDLIIIGGGAAGMTAAVYAARAGLKTTLLESNITGGLVNATYTVENFPSYPSIHGMALMEKMREHVDSLQVRVEEVCDITRLELTEDIKRVYKEDEVLTARAVILATGRAPVPLETPTPCDQVHYCAICDGAAYKGKRVLVVGGGNSAFDESLYLLGMGVEHVTLVEKMPRFFAAQSTQQSLLSHENVEAYTDTQVEDLYVEEDELRAVSLVNSVTGERSRIPVSGIFAFLGQKPNTALFAGQVELTEDGYIKADARMKTSVPGVFGAGDVVDKPYRQIVTAVADGAIAALEAERYMRAKA